MARKKISEFKAKSLVLSALSIPYQGISLQKGDTTPLSSLDENKKYVLKVDQGIKKRFKLGLVALNISKTEIEGVMNDLAEKGYQSFILEEYLEHDQKEERYLSFERTRDGITFMASRSGGVTVEDNMGQIKKFTLPHQTHDAAEYLELPEDILRKIVQCMDRLHISFLEINPLVVSNNDLTFLDMAIEVDDAGEFFVEKAWVSEDFVVEAGSKTKEEEAIEELSSKSQASFRLVVLNPNGSIFMLLSGGGASIVLADEVYNVGQGKELANYGEYSGNPNAEETYLYTKEILSLLLSSSASNKKLIIAGGVANFTDIRITFKGVIKAIADVKTMLSEQGVKVFVRRGGPFEKEGLQMIEDFLKKENLYGFVTGPNLPLTEIVEKAIGGAHA